MIYLRSTIFFIFLVIWTILVGVLGIMTFITLNKKKVAITVYFWSIGAIYALRLICNTTFKVHGENNIPKENAIYACKHQSAWETIFFLYYFKNAVYVLKKELSYIPIYGWYLPAIGMISVDRKGGARVLKQTIAGVRCTIANSRNVIIFPEGTRVAPNESIDLKPGVAAIHSFLPDIPIVPVSLDSGLYWIRKTFLIKPGCINIYFKKPIVTKLKKEELLKKLKDDINSTSIN